MALDGKTAVVTGAARGIGYAYCRRLAADGANVVAVDVDDPAGAVKELTGGARLGLMCDVSEPSQVDAVAGVTVNAIAPGLVATEGSWAAPGRTARPPRRSSPG